MQVVLTPYYQDLFPDGKDTLEELLEDIPTVPLLSFIAYLDAELYSRDDGNETQLMLLNFMLHKQPAEFRAAIMNNAFSKASNSGERRFFTRHYNLSFLHYILTHFKEGDFEDYTVEQELAVFKAYFLIAEQFGQQPRDEGVPLPSHDADFFGKMIWPTMADNYESNFSVYPYHIFLRGMVFFNYLQCHSNYSGYVNAFLQRHQKKTSLNYMSDISQILRANYEANQEGTTEFAPFSLGPAPGFETIYEQFTLDPVAYAQQYGNNKANYAGIKSRPLYKVHDKNWLVLNWSFLSNKLYEGLIFDFYQNSGIAAEAAFNSFPKFKQFIGQHITEKYLFRQLADNAWKRKYNVLLFDDEERTDGFPDGYYRKGNNVFLFEIKDAYFPSAAVNSYAYEQIKAAIDEKINNPKKGSGQLIKQLQHLKSQAYESPQRYKSPAHLTIYPIIIYTDLHFNMPGVNEYVNRTFQNMLG